MKNFTTLIKESKDNYTRTLSNRIDTQLREIYESEARFLEEKLNEFGFECHEHRVTIKNGYKIQAGIRVYFTTKDVEYVLIDYLSEFEFELYTVNIDNNIKKPDQLIQKSTTLEATVKSLMEKLNNKKTVTFYVMDQETEEERKVSIDGSDLFDKNKKLPIKKICLELFKKVYPQLKNDDESFMSDMLVVDGVGYQLLGSQHGYTIMDDKENDIVSVETANVTF